MKFEDLDFCIYCNDVCSKASMIYDIPYSLNDCCSPNMCKHFRSCEEVAGFDRCFK